MRHLSDIKPGQVIGRYEFLAPIAQGGMAAVWAARQRGSRGFSKVVAIKTMLPSISEDPRFERMFLDEAQIASRIHHEHVVEILDLGEENEILYLVMEWVDGESLSVLRRRAAERDGIALRLAVRIIADVCAGLHAAHELCDDEGKQIGLVHRDVSPQNILVGYDGNVKVLDFGVAKIAGRTSDTTSIGYARGKPPYMAPEQALGKSVDRRADVFSLGIIFYQLLAGRHPFRGENDIATLHNIISDQSVVRPSELVPTITDAVEKVALRAIERDPDRRYQSALELELALESVLDSQLGRVRQEDIGRLMGSAQEERRTALRDAIRIADSAELTQRDVSIRALPDEASSVGKSALDVALGGGGTEPDASASPVSDDSAWRSANRTMSPVSSRPVGGWWQVLLALIVGATLAWLGSLWLSRSQSHKLLTHNTVELQPTASPVVKQSQVVTNDASSTAGASQLLDLRESRRKALGRRSSVSGSRSAPGGGVNQWNALPPVPSPGF